MLKAARIAKQYETASNCTAFIIEPDSCINDLNSICRQCDHRKCEYLHIEAANKARELGGSYIYLCRKNLAFWTSPFYAGERFAGALFSGGVKSSEKNINRVKALAQIMLLCADKISGTNFIRKKTKSGVSCIDEEKISRPVSLREASKNPKKTTDAFQTEEQKCKAAAENINPADISALDMERMLLASLRRGDNIEGHKILLKLLKIHYAKANNNFQVFQLKALELAVLLSRAVADPKDIIDNTALDAANRCIKKIEESRNFKEITDILSSITDRMSGLIFSFHGVRHFSALRKAERYIWENYTRKLSLREIAGASGLSAPYFSTVFKEEMGENLSNYLNKLRVEKAAAMLVTTNTPISEVARVCGFEDQSWFSKIFKNNKGFTPGKYRELGIHTDDTATGGIYAVSNI